MSIHLDLNVALIIVDLQDDFISELDYRANKAIRNSFRLIAAFRKYRLPVFVVLTIGLPPGRIDAENCARTIRGYYYVQGKMLDPGCCFIRRRTWSAFSGTTLQRRLQRSGITQVVIAGLRTGISVESTARHAYDLSYNVALATDAMADRGFGRHVNSVVGVFPSLGEVVTTYQLIRQIRRREPN